MEIKKEKLDSCLDNKQDLVWARLKYCPYWPARVVATPPSIGKTPPNKICVIFFGTKQYGFVDLDKVQDYSTNRLEFMAKGKGKAFIDAVHKIDEYISDAVKYKSNAVVKPANIVVKTEQQVESVLGIKRENDSHRSGIESNGSSFISQPNTNSWPQEKESLIEKIVSLKSENQRILFDLKKIEDKFGKMVNENRSLKKKVDDDSKTHLNQLDQLQDKLAESNATQKKTNDDNTKRTAELTREKDLYRALFKQLQNVFAQQTAAQEQTEPNDDDDKFYEVECLLDGSNTTLSCPVEYNSSHDSWVDEENLNCLGKLKQYMKSKNK